MRRTAILLVTTLALTSTATTQEPEKFEVASVRPSVPNSGRPAFNFNPGGGIRATNVTLQLLIQLAYEIRPEQLSGGPPWSNSEEYTVVAKSPAEGLALSAPERKALTLLQLQKLLAERFHLLLKIDANPTAGYVLKVDRKGHKMAAASEPAAHRFRQTGRWQMEAEGVDMTLLTRFLTVHLQATVIDQTQLQDQYTFHLNWTPNPLPSSIAALNGLPEESLIPAAQEQLGLKLERQKVSTDRYTILHAEKPTGN